MTLGSGTVRAAFTFSPGSVGASLPQIAKQQIASAIGEREHGA